MQAEEPTQLTQVPPQPTCTQIFNTGTCADLWKNYRQALAQRQREEAQLYINRQKELASAEATAPLQQQIADLHKLVGDQQGQIKKLQDKMQEQIQADAAAAEQGRSVAHSQGMQQGAGIGVAASLVLYGLIFAVRKLAGKAGTNKPQVRAASATS
jgi:flagellar biosynthesis/type III secretory pathway protein FliH